MELGLQDLQRGMALLEAGSTADAIDAFKSAAESGFAEGYVQLARAEIERGNHDAARNYMQHAEALAERGDALANLSCSLAYQMAYGEGSLAQQEEKARYFLRRAAELGNPVAQCMLAQQLLWASTVKCETSTNMRLGSGEPSTLVSMRPSLLMFRMS
jgi:TPR repeat protein